MRIEMDIGGDKEFGRAVKKLSEKAQERVQTQIASIATDLIKNVEKNYSSAGKGNLYFRIPGEKYMTIRVGSQNGVPVAYVPNSGKQNLSLTHQASAAGDPPAKDTGDLVAGVYMKSIDAKSFRVGNKIKYAAWLEYGTRKIKPRPNWVPESEKARDKFVQLIELTLARLIKEQSK